MDIKTCACGQVFSSFRVLAAHHKDCTVWQDQLGQCEICKRRHYRHVQVCPNEGEDRNRRRLIEKHGIPQGLFEDCLRELNKQYSDGRLKSKRAYDN